MNRIVIAATALLLCAGHAASAGAPHSFTGANRAYGEGRWDDAVAGYESLVAAGLVNRDLYFNLGNAYFRSGHLGPAIYNYERALRLSPSFADAKHNLALARDEVATRWPDRMKSAEKPSTWIRIVTFLSTRTLTVLFLAFNLAFFCGLIFVRLVRRGAFRTSLIVTSVVAGMLTISAAVLLWSNVHYTQKVHYGIVLNDQLHMREGAYEQSGEGALIHAGLRVRVIGRESGWVQIGLANGHAGWVPDKAIGEL